MYGSAVYMEKVLKNKTLKPRLLSVVISIFLAAADQLTKYLAVQFIKPVGSVPLIKFGDTEWLNFTYVENTGMSFSLLEGQRAILIAIPIILIGLVEWFIFSGRAERTDVLIALSALAGGGLGNLIDRVFLGYVVDFIDVRIINFAIFNFADICAVCGGIYFGVVLIIDEFRSDKAKKAEKAGAAEKQDISTGAEDAETSAENTDEQA